jgi:hypothetical protein
MAGLTRSAGTWLEHAGNEILATAHEAAWRYGWSYPDELRSLKGHQAILDALRSVRAGKSYGEAISIEDLSLARAGIHQITNDDNGFWRFASSDPRSLLSQAVLSEQKFPARLLRIEAGKRLVITAIALERFKLAHGEYPESLSSLASQYLTTVLLDPVDKQPMRYHRQPDGTFLLYSIGPDGIDNGGDSTPPPNTREFPWMTAKDQVWPRPASQEEIEQFLAKHARK